MIKPLKHSADHLRQLITQLEPFMEEFDGSLVELDYHAEKLAKRLERDFVSDIGSVEGLLLAALVNRLQFLLHTEEVQLREAMRIKLLAGVPPAQR